MIKVKEANGSIFEYARDNVECMAIWMYYGFSGFKVDFNRRFLNDLCAERRIVHKYSKNEMRKDLFESSDYSFISRPELTPALYEIVPALGETKYLYFFNNYRNNVIEGNEIVVQEAIEKYMKGLIGEMIKHSISSVAINAFEARWVDHIAEEEYSHAIGAMVVKGAMEISRSIVNEIEVHMITTNRYGFGLYIMEKLET